MRPKEVYARVDTVRDKIPGMHCGHFASLRDAATYIKKTIREFGPPKLIVVEEEGGSRAFDISFTPEAEAISETIDESVRSEKPRVSYLSLSRLTLEFRLEIHWSFYHKNRGVVVQQYQARSFAEIGPAIELFQSFEKNLGVPRKVVLFDFAAA